MKRRYIHIGSWNIEHLSKKKDERVDNIYALTEHIEMASLDVIALQEIYVTSLQDGVRRNLHLDGVVNLLFEHTEDKWTYQLLPNSREDDTSQLCGLLWNTSVLNKEGEFKLPVNHEVDGDRLWDRAPCAIKFKCLGKTDFAIVPLHMKSNYNGATVGRRVREKEARELVAALPKVRETLSDLDIVLIGDTNCLGSYERALEIITKADFEDLNAADSQTFVGGGPFDRVFVPENRQAFSYSRQYIMVSANATDHDRFLSDHYLIKTVLKIRDDDDL